LGNQIKDDDTGCAYSMHEMKMHLWTH